MINNSKAWVENADMVVKDPNSPIEKNKNNWDFESTIAITIPMIKQPITLTMRILSGKYDSVGSSLLAIKYLVSAPIEPPTAINR